MKLLQEQLLRVLVALTVVMVWFTSPGSEPRLVEGAPLPELPSVTIAEPEIPEQELLLARRRQEAIDRSSRIQRWEAEQYLQEATAAHRKRVNQEQGERRQQLAQVADLVPPGYRRLVLDVASEYGVEPRLIAAVATVESRWRPTALGAHGDSGIMQIIPSTATWIARRMELSAYDIFDPQTNLMMGAWYLKTLREEYGSWDKALAAYNGGPRAAGLGAEHPYVGRVMHVYQRQGSYTFDVEPFRRGEVQ